MIFDIKFDKIFQIIYILSIDLACQLVSVYIIWPKKFKAEIALYFHALYNSSAGMPPNHVIF